MKKETVLISMCSMGIPCQYRPKSVMRAGFVAELRRKYNLVPVCPEQLGGLPTPRPACHLEGRRVIGRDGVEYTTEYQRGADLVKALANKLGCNRAYFKKKSPSCDPQTGVTATLLRHSGLRVLGI